MHQIQSSGVLVVLSQAWIEELYHQVLERNLLGEAGYWESPEEHLRALITMLTGNKHTARVDMEPVTMVMYIKLYLTYDIVKKFLYFVTAKIIFFSLYEYNWIL